VGSATACPTQAAEVRHLKRARTERAGPATDRWPVTDEKGVILTYRKGDQLRSSRRRSFEPRKRTVVGAVGCAWRWRSGDLPDARRRGRGRVLGEGTRAGFLTVAVRVSGQPIRTARRPGPWTWPSGRALPSKSSSRPVTAQSPTRTATRHGPRCWPAMTAWLQPES
jgi:hypothetical protein